MNLQKKLFSRGWHGPAMAVSLTACLFGMTACDQYDLDERNPEGWGASIYSYLDEAGNFKNTVRLIDDLGLKEVLAKTGSKTVFVADDEAFARFYTNNSWGVKNYEQLSLAQKKMLLLGAMINNSYQINNLSSIEGPVEGQCMRRTSSQTIYDSVAVVSTSALPNMKPEEYRYNDTWKRFAERDKIVLMKDNTIPPMLHFIEAQMRNNKITNDDYNWLYNYTTERKPGDASVNGIKISQQNIKCSNGFIHKVEDVIMPLENMAEVISKKPQASMFYSMLERFATPFYAGQPTTEQYNYQFNKNVDSVFVKRYFSRKSAGGAPIVVDDKDRIVTSILNINKSSDLFKFDPGWNAYYTGNAIPNANTAMQRDMAVLMVPTNTALDEYWNEGAGVVLKNQYKTWDNVPNRVIVELINNNMLSSFVESVPSKFDGILNDANDPMGVSKSAIDSVFLSCNGAVYLTKKVFSPTSFVSVLYPAVVNENMKIIDWAVGVCQYNVYLNSLNSYYSFFIPTNEALNNYIDPTSYGQAKTKLYRFKYDERLANPVWAAVYEYNKETGEIGDSIGEDRDYEHMRARLKDILDNHIVIGNVEDGHEYYRTKGGQEIKVNNVSAGINGMTVSGSLQASNNQAPLRVKDIYDQTKDGNGKVYVLEDEPIQTTNKTVMDILREHDEFYEMAKLFEGSSMLEQLHDKKYACAGENLSVFNTYHYTVYIPTNDAIKEMQKAGKLPTWEDVDKAAEMEDFKKKTADSLAIENFLRYHIQDYSLFIGAKPQARDGYETSLINENTGKFERLYTTLTDNNIEIRTVNRADAPAVMVDRSKGLYNLQAREYILNNMNAEEASGVYTTSTIVIHQIDGVLKK